MSPHQAVSFDVGLAGPGKGAWYIVTPHSKTDGTCRSTPKRFAQVP